MSNDAVSSALVGGGLGFIFELAVRPRLSRFFRRWRQRRALKQMTQEAQELGFYDDPPVVPRGTPLPEAVRVGIEQAKQGLVTPVPPEVLAPEETTTQLVRPDPNGDPWLRRLEGIPELRLQDLPPNVRRMVEIPDSARPFVVEGPGAEEVAKKFYAYAKEVSYEVGNLAKARGELDRVLRGGRRGRQAKLGERTRRALLKVERAMMRLEAEVNGAQLRTWGSMIWPFWEEQNPASGSMPEGEKKEEPK